MWARSYSQCAACERSDRPHMAKGLCNHCYQVEYRLGHPEVSKESKENKRRWYEENIQGTERGRLERERRYFANLREPTLRRDNFRCVRCGATEKLVVHHKDGQGRISKEPNNTLDNLETLCRACHMAAHRLEMLAIRHANGYRRRKIGRWSRKWDHCQRCGTTEIKHEGQGYCRNCHFWVKHHRPELLRPTLQSQNSGRRRLRQGGKNESSSLPGLQ